MSRTTYHVNRTDVGKRADVPFLAFTDALALVDVDFPFADDADFAFLARGCRDDDIDDEAAAVLRFFALAVTVVLDDPALDVLAEAP